MESGLTLANFCVRYPYAIPFTLYRVLGPPGVLGLHRVLGPVRVLGPRRVLGPCRVLRPRSFLGPGSSQGPGSCYSGMPVCTSLNIF